MFSIGNYVSSMKLIRQVITLWLRRKSMIKKYKKQLAEVISIEVKSNLEEFTKESTIGRDIVEFYKRIVENVLKVTVYVSVDEVSNGKYQVHFHMEDNLLLSLCSKACDDAQMVLENILENIIKPYLEVKR